jgi:glutamyl-tRNA synthetase
MERVRFAPSPTGPLHIGGLRTAIFNYLYARKHKGAFILRVEDTDLNRYVEGSERYIQESLEWCGMVPDEGPFNGGSLGPYRQSERKSIYLEYIQILLAKGKAYYAFDSTDELSAARSLAELQGETFRYGAHNRANFVNSLTLNENEIEERKKGDYVIRLKVDPGAIISVFDEVRGTVSVATDELDDKVLMKSDGMPTYHFANVVDDYLMKITCVIRGEEWLPSLPHHQLLYNAFDWKSPKFMHLPLILKPNGKGKLSKRDGDKDGFPVFPLQWKDNVGFKEKGFLPESMVNYLVLLGWNSGKEDEFFTLSELEGLFSVSGVQKGGARFDYEKARWINHQHLLKKTPQELLTLEAFKLALNNFSFDQKFKIATIIKDRLYTLDDIQEEVKIFNTPYPFDNDAIEKLLPKNPLQVLQKAESILNSGEHTVALKETLLDWAKKQSISVGVLMQSLRIALVGKLTGPDLFDIIEILGNSVSLLRIKNAISYINLKQKS